jgi:hypothetical protein
MSLCLCVCVCVLPRVYCIQNHYSRVVSLATAAVGRSWAVAVCYNMRHSPLITPHAVACARCCAAHPADTPDARPVRERYADVVPAAGSVVDLLVRAKDRTTGAPLRASQIVAQVWCCLHSSSIIFVTLVRVCACMLTHMCSQIQCR